MKRQYTTRLCSFVLFLLTISQTACERRVATDASPVPKQECEHVLVILLDLSGSFADRMLSDDASAYRFFMRLSDKYFRDRIGGSDQLIIGQISGTDRGLLWQGSPLALRRAFPNAKAFRDFVVARSDPRASRVYDSITDALDYVMALPAVGDETKVVAVVLSDMLDTTPDSEGAERRVRQTLAKFGKRGGALLLYWVDQTLVSTWTTYLRESGIKHYAVSSGIVEDPQLPVFE